MANSDYTNLKELTDEGIEDFADLTAKTPALVYFGAVWCGPCKTYGPLFNDYAGAHPDVPAFAVDGDDSPEVTEKYNVNAFPTTLLLVNDTIIWRREGEVGDDVLRSEIATALADTTTAAPRRERDVRPRTLTTATIPRRDLPNVNVEIRVGDAENGPRQLNPGERVTVEPGQLIQIQIGVDPLAQEDDLIEWLEQFPQLPIGEIELMSEAVDMVLLERVLLLNPAGLSLIVEHPLPAEAIDAVEQSTVTHAEIEAPGFSAPETAVRLQGVTVNGMRVTPSFAAEALPTVPWTSPADVEARIASGERFTAVVQYAHPAATQRLASYVEALGDVVFVSRFDEPALTRFFPFAYKEDVALFGVEDGQIRWRVSLPEGDNAFYADDIAERWQNSQGESLAPLEPWGEQTIDASDPAQDIAVVNDRGINAGTVWIGDRPVTIPAGWRTIRESAIYPGEEEGEEQLVPDTSGVDELVVWVETDEEWDARILAPSDQLTLLHFMSTEEVVGMPETIGKFPRLRFLWTETMTDELRSEIRSAYPDLIIDGAWPE